MNRLDACLSPRIRAGTFWFLLGGLGAAAQPAPAPAPTDTVKLSAFEVSSQKDFGYRATNSITATGIGTEIYRTPINVSVVTRDLIQDLGATSLRESMQYTGGVLTDRRDPGTLTSRGFGSAVLVNRNGGAVRNPAADFIERIEFVKGPNAVFFGRVSPSGVVNLITLQPKATTETEVRGTYGSYDYLDAFVSHNQRLGDKAAVRVAGSFLDREDGYIDWTYRRQNAGLVAFTWDVLPKLKFNVTGQIVDAQENVLHSNPRGHPGYREYTRVNPTSTLTIQQWQAAFIPGQPYMTTYLDPAEIFTSGRKGNNNGPDAFKLDEAKFVQPEFIFTAASWLTLRAAGNFARYHTETLETSGFPTFDGTYIAQRPSFNGSRSISNIGELEAVFTFNTGVASHRLLAGAREAIFRSGSFAATNNTATPQAGQTLPVTWNNRTMGARYLIRDGFVGGRLVVPYFAMPRSEESGIYAIDQVGFANDRLKVLLGVRRTKVKNIGSTAAIPALDRSQEETTPQLGVLAEPVKGIALFANYAKTFEPQFSVDARGNLANNISGKGTEAGVKIDLGESAWSGTVTWFKLERSGEIRRDFSAEVSTGISPLFVPGGTKRSEGADLELFYTPARNYQAIVSYTNLWSAKAVSDLGAPAIVGRRLERSPRHQFALWNKYTFTGGALRAWSLGLGLRYTSMVDTLLDPNFDLKNPSFVETNAVISYAAKLGQRPVTLQLNIKNILDRDYLDGNFTPADPRTFYFTMGTKF